MLEEERFKERIILGEGNVESYVRGKVGWRGRTETPESLTRGSKVF